MTRVILVYNKRAKKYFNHCYYFTLLTFVNHISNNPTFLNDKETNGMYAHTFLNHYYPDNKGKRP